MRSEVKGYTVPKQKSLGRVETLAIFDRLLSASNGLRRHVKRCSFSHNFRWLSYKHRQFPARVATLSQHLFYEPPYPPGLGAGRRTLANGFPRTAKRSRASYPPQHPAMSASKSDPSRKLQEISLYSEGRGSCTASRRRVCQSRGQQSGSQTAGSVQPCGPRAPLLFLQAAWPPPLSGTRSIAP